ncbi:LuxR family transcriptional regulator [Jannaschia sp.]|nr:LuxR family transcriptional regulator [Jannaschia sp.]
MPDATQLDHAPLTPEAQLAAMGVILRADTVDAAWDAFTQITRSIGFDYLLYAQARHPGPPNPVDPAEVLLLHHGPRAWLDSYVDEQLYLGNPLFDWAQTNSGFKAVSEVASGYDGPVTPQLARLIQLRVDHGIGPGFLGGLRDAMPGVNAAMSISLATDVDEATAHAVWAAHGTPIETMARAMHLRVSTLPQPLLRPLSSRQREVLEWSSQGKTVKDIGVIMAVEATTVEKHLRLAREALNATNTSHAVRKALTLNLLSV